MYMFTHIHHTHTQISLGTKDKNNLGASNLNPFSVT